MEASANMHIWAFGSHILILWSTQNLEVWLWLQFKNAKVIQSSIQSSNAVKVTYKSISAQGSTPEDARSSVGFFHLLELFLLFAKSYLWAGDENGGDDGDGDGSKHLPSALPYVLYTQ